MPSPPNRRSNRLRWGVQRLPTLSPDDSDCDSLYSEALSPPHPSPQHKKTKRTRKAPTSRRPSGLSPGSTGSSHRGQNVVRHHQLHRYAACSACRRRRTKCDAAKPSCSACIRHRNHLRRRSHSGAQLKEYDCGCVYEGEEGDADPARGSQLGSSDHADDGELKMPPSPITGKTMGKRGGESAAPLRRLSQASRSEVVVTPPLTPGQDTSADMGWLGGELVSMSDEVTSRSPVFSKELPDITAFDQTSLPLSLAYPSFTYQDTYRTFDQTHDLSYPTSLYYPLQSSAVTPTQSGGSSYSQSLDSALGQSSTYPDTYSTHSYGHSQPYQSQAGSSSSTPAVCGLDTFPPGLPAAWPTMWDPETRLSHSTSLAFPQQHHSGPDFSTFRDPAYAMSLDADARYWAEQASPFSEAHSLPHSPFIASGAQAGEDSAACQFCLSDDQANGNHAGSSRLLTALDLSGAADGMGLQFGDDHPIVGAGQQSCTPGPPGGGPREGRAQPGLEERMRAAGAVPGPLTTDQLFLMMQLLENPSGPML